MIEDYIESQNYILSPTEEANHFNDINSLLKNLENLLRLNSAEMNQSKIIEASIICESMLKLLLKKKGYLFKENTPFSCLIDFSSTKKIIPKECDKFLQTILTYRNESVHGINTTNKLTSTFLNAFVIFVSWFEGNYPSQKQLRIRNCCEIINSRSYKEIKSFKSIGAEHKTAELAFNTCKKCGFTIENSDNFCPNCGIKIERSAYISNIKQDMILDILNQQNESLIQILETVLQTSDIIKGIDQKINLITNRLDQIQTQTEKLIDIAWSEEEIDRIIHVHTSECIESILEHENDIRNDDNYEYVRKNLFETFGNSSWAKLSEKSKTFLITSKVMFNKLISMSDVIDYSGIYILVTKSLEVEIHKRFFTDFIEYLDKNYNRDYSAYPTKLLFNDTKPLHADKFTMGNVFYLLCPEKDRYITSEQKANNKEKLMEYCKSNLFSEYDDEGIERLLNRYAYSIEDIKRKYRNPSAHRNQIACTDAKKCIDLIIDVEKLLKRMLDSFDY